MPSKDGRLVVASGEGQFAWGDRDCDIDPVVITLLSAAIEVVNPCRGFAGEDGGRVIGFDVMNEPFMGSEANKITPLLLESYAKLMAEQTKSQVRIKQTT